MREDIVRSYIGNENIMKISFLMSIILLALLPAMLFAQTGKAVVPEIIEIPDNLRVRYGFDYTQYYGVLNSQKELNQIWRNLINIQDEIAEFNRWLPWVKGKVPPAPEIDFEQHSVIWYTNKGSGASFVESIKVFEEQQNVRVKIGLFYSDFGSSHLNLWRVSKINKEVIFEESKHFETRGP